MKAALFCIACGHALHDVTLKRAEGRPTLLELRRAYDENEGESRPYWAGGKPGCPRCGASMFLELGRPRAAEAATVR